MAQAKKSKPARAGKPKPRARRSRRVKYEPQEHVGPGRPSSLTPRVQAIVVQALSDGLTLIDASKLAGVDYATVKRWRAKGAKSTASPEFRAFCAAVDFAKLEAKATMCMLIKKHAKGSWNAAAWWLEKHFPREYGAKHLVAQQVEEAITSILAVVKGHVDDATYRRVLDSLTGAPSGTSRSG